MPLKDDWMIHFAKSSWQRWFVDPTTAYPKGEVLQWALGKWPFIFRLVKCYILCTHTYLPRTAIEFQQNHIWNHYQKLEKTSRRIADHHHFKKENTFISATTETVFFGRLRVSGFVFWGVSSSWAMPWLSTMAWSCATMMKSIPPPARHGHEVEWGTKLRDLHISFGLERLR